MSGSDLYGGLRPGRGLHAGLQLTLRRFLLALYRPPWSWLSMIMAGVIGYLVAWWVDASFFG